MPYPRAHFYVLGVIAVILGGFWPTYFSIWTNVPWQFHAHGIAASTWVAMVGAQSWLAHHKQLALHRAVGRTSLFLFPFLIGGFAGIIDVTAKGYVAANDPVRLMFGPEFLVGMAIAIAAYVTVFYRALKFRRKVWAHSGYMLTTPLILFESPFSRLMNLFVPGLIIRGPADLHLIMPGILWAIGLELLFIAAIWLKYRARAAPFLVAGAFILAQLLAMGLMGDVQLLKSLLVALAHVPSAVVILSGFAIGAITSWAGWQAGKRRGALVAGAAQPA